MGVVDELSDRIVRVEIRHFRTINDLKVNIEMSKKIYIRIRQYDSYDTRYSSAYERPFAR